MNGTISGHPGNTGIRVWRKKWQVIDKEEAESVREKLQILELNSGWPCNLLPRLGSFWEKGGTMNIIPGQKHKLELSWQISMCALPRYNAPWQRDLVIVWTNDKVRKRYCVSFLQLLWQSTTGCVASTTKLIVPECWRLEVQYQGVGRVGWFLLRPLSLNCRWPCSPCISMWPFVCMCLCLNFLPHSRRPVLLGSAYPSELI